MKSAEVVQEAKQVQVSQSVKDKYSGPHRRNPPAEKKEEAQVPQSTKLQINSEQSSKSQIDEVIKQSEKSQIDTLKGFQEMEDALD